MISFSCKARSRHTDCGISYIANNPGREKKRRTIWHKSFLNLQKWALIAWTEMFFLEENHSLKCRHSKEKCRMTATWGVNTIKGNEHHEPADPRDLFCQQNEFNMYEKYWAVYHKPIVRAQLCAWDLQTRIRWEALSFFWAKRSCINCRDGLQNNPGPSLPVLKNVSIA